MKYLHRAPNQGTVFLYGRSSHRNKTKLAAGLQGIFPAGYGGDVGVRVRVWFALYDGVSKNVLLAA